MSRLKLGKLEIIEPTSILNSFVVGDIYNGGGYEDPLVIEDERTLARHFRYHPQFKALREIIRNGAALAIAGNRTSFTDNPTITIFNQNSEIPACSDGRLVRSATINYEDLIKEPEKLLRELLEESLLLTTKEQLLQYTGFNNSEFTYRIVIKPTANLAHKLLTGINTLVLPRYVPDSDYEYNNWGILFQNTSGVPESTDIEFGSRGITGYVGKVTVTASMNVRQILEAILDVRSPDDPEIKLVDLYLNRGETLQILGEGNDSYLVYESPRPIRFWNFCEQFCPAFRFLNDQSYTQRVYYLRGYYNQGITLCAHSNIANKEGRGIDLKFSCTNGWMNLVIQYLDEEYEVVGSNLSELVKNFYLLTFDKINYSTSVDGVEYESEVEERVFQTNSYITPEYNQETTVRAYQSFQDYEVHCSVMMAPMEYELYDKVSLFPVLKKLMNDYTLGGMQTTLCIQLDNDNYIPTVKRALPNAFFFTGSFEYDCIYQYLIKYLRDKSMSPDPGYSIVQGLKDTLTVHYNGYEIEYDDAQEYVLSLGISHVINSVYTQIYPGISRQGLRTVVQNCTQNAVNMNPLLIDCSIDSLKIVQNTLVVELVITYRLYYEEYIINFKIYKEYD